MTEKNKISRRDWLAGAAAVSLSGRLSQSMAAADRGKVKPKSVAAIITAYEKGLHADVLVGKILEGWRQDGGPGPALTLASMYVEQFTDRDLARGLAAKYDVPMFDTIEGAVTAGSDWIPVDGVISIGEHGTYPYNDKGQHLYPRRRFFEGITNTFEKYGQVVPVFNDKHLGPVWDDAKWMYERARDLKIPFMAGSSIPVTFREADGPVPLGCDIEAAVGIGYSGLDIYGSHTLECFQCLVERRRGGETGVRSVQCLEGDAVWQAVDDGVVDNDALRAAARVVPRRSGADMRAGKSVALFLFEYTDGLRGTVLMLPEFSGGFAVGLKIRGRTEPLATHFEERPEPRHPHFAYLLKGIERMMHTGRPSYPVERTLLTSGILDRALTSRAQNYQKLTTPELGIRYTPADYPHAPKPDLSSDPTGA